MGELNTALFWRDAWAKAHTNRKRPCLQRHEEYLWHRFQVANGRVARAFLESNKRKPPSIRDHMLELEGWKKVTDPRFESDILWHLKGRGFDIEKNLPNYLEDLNAVQKVFRGLDGKTQRLSIRWLLIDLHHGESYNLLMFSYAFLATPAQWCNAILKATGKLDHDPSHS
jgi:hypothetical protein